MNSLLNYSRLARHSKIRAAQKNETSTCTRSSAHKARGSVCDSMARETEEWWFDVRSKGVGKRRPYLIEELCSQSSELSSTPDATTARWYEAFEAHVVSSPLTCRKSRRLSCGSTHGTAASSQPTRRSECSSPSATKPRPKGSGPSGVDPMRAREIHRCPRSECGSVGRHCFSRNSRHARDAEGRVVGREHERVRSGMTGQSLFGAVKGDQNTDGHFDTDSDVCVTSQPCFPERGSMVPLHLLAEHRKRRASTTACREGGKARKNTGRRTRPQCSASLMRDSNYMVCFMWICEVISGVFVVRVDGSIFRKC